MQKAVCSGEFQGSKMLIHIFYSVDFCNAQGCIIGLLTLFYCHSHGIVLVVVIIVVFVVIVVVIIVSVVV